MMRGRRGLGGGRAAVRTDPPRLWHGGARAAGAVTLFDPPPPTTSIFSGRARAAGTVQGGVLAKGTARAQGRAEPGVRFLGRGRATGVATMGAAPAAWPNGYRLRALVRIPPGSIYGGAALAGALIWFSRTRPEFRSVGNGGFVQAADGKDIRFETTAGVKLPHILDSYDPAAGRVGAWVRLPTLTPGQTNDFHCYIGKAGLLAGEADPAATAVDYIAWWNTVTGVDHTGQPGRSLTMAGGPAQATVIGSGASYDGIDDQGSLVLGVWFGGWAALTMRAVVNPDPSMIGQTRGIIVQGPADGRGTECGLALYFRPKSADNVDANVLLANVTCGTTAAQQAFAVSKAGGAETGLQALTSTWTSGEVPKLYKSRVGDLTHGILLPLNNSAPATGTVQGLPAAVPGTLRVGRGVNSTAAGFLEAGPFKGLIDEVRLRASVMTAAHIATEDFSLLDPEAFFGLGSFDAFDDQNRGPVAVPDFVSTQQNTAILIDAVANDVDPEGLPRTLLAVEAPTSGAAVIDTNKIRYTPAAGFTGAASLRYTVRDAGTPQKTSIGKVRVEVVGSAVLTGAYRYAAPALPADDANFVIQPIGAAGGTLTNPNDWNKVLLVVGPNAAVGTGFRLQGRDMKCRGIAIVGLTINRTGYHSYSHPGGQQINGGDVFDISFINGAPVRPWLWISRILYNPTDSRWGDWIKTGSRIVGADYPFNSAEYMDLYVQKVLMTNGHITFTTPDTANGNETHSDFVQFSLGGYNRAIFADCHVFWSGNGMYYLQSGNAGNAASGKTMGPNTAEFVFDHLNHEWAPGAVGASPSQYWLQGGLASVWNTVINGESALSGGRYTSAFTREYWGRKHAGKPDPSTYFGTPNIGKTVVDNEVRFTPFNPGLAKRPDGKGVVEGDRKVSFIESAGTFPNTVVTTAEVGFARRVATIAQLRAEFT